MRVSVDKDDPGYAPEAQGARVFLDGVEVQRVITADEEHRLIVQAEVDESGRLLLTPDRTDIRRVTRYGSVRVELPPSILLAAWAVSNAVKPTAQYLAGGHCIDRLRVSDEQYPPPGSTSID